MSGLLMRPAEPLVVVLGSTGTGKSDLAVELALQFDGEVINADAMQMYRGLPVTTNKISVEEQRGVPHHLLGTVNLHAPTWRVDRFRREASHIIREIRGRGRLPIVVGGSQYYTDGLLFDDHLVDEGGEFEEGEPTGEDAENGDDNGKRFPILDGPTETMFAELARVDPVMAGRWHPNDRRKIRRSLEIFLTMGRRASDIYADQRQHKVEKEMARQQQRESRVSSCALAHASGESLSFSSPLSPPPPPWQCLLLWVYTKPGVLNARLDARVDTMLARGLEQEATEMYDTLQDLAARGVSVDRTKGIWQSIGYKEMEPYIEALRQCADDDTLDDKQKDAALATLRAAGVDAIKFGTHRYARYQLRWIKHKTIPYLVDAHALDRLFLLDSTDKAQWHKNVAEIGVRLTATFLGKPRPSNEGEGEGEGEEKRTQTFVLPRPVDVSETAREVLTATIAASRGTAAEAGKQIYRQDCVICHTTLLSEDQWNKHIRGSRHRRMVQKQKRRALVAVLPAEAGPPSTSFAASMASPHIDQAVVQLGTPASEEASSMP